MPEGGHDPENITGRRAGPFYGGSSRYSCSGKNFPGHLLPSAKFIILHIKIIPRKIPGKFGNMTLHSLAVLCIIIQNEQFGGGDFSDYVS
jgi:hypothetical protein